MDVEIAYETAYAYVRGTDVPRFNVPPTLDELEESLASNPHYAYLYAKRVLKKRFIRGEMMISTNSRTSLLYAIYVMHGRFELGESAIATFADDAIDYAILIKGRFKMGEPVIRYRDRSIIDYVNAANEGNWEGCENLFLELCGENSPQR